MSRNSKVLLYSPDLSGHRASFLDFASRTLNGCRARTVDLVRDPRPALFLMIEDDFLGFVALSLLRAITGRVSVGFLFRPLPTVEGSSGRLRLKYFVLRGLRMFRGIRVLTIVPIPLAPKIGNIALDWVYDLQLWDIETQQRNAISVLRTEDASAGAAKDTYVRILERAQGRKVLVALGSQSRAKGFPELVGLLDTAVAKKWLIVSLGKISDDLKPLKLRLEAAGHLVEDRFISDEELLAGYAAADAVWCRYDSSYDQASGILGRAAQFGIASIVRPGSLNHMLCVSESIPHAAAETPNDCAAALDNLPRPQPELGDTLTNRFRQTSLARLRTNLIAASDAK